MNTEKPNILVIMSDEHDARIMGCAGDPTVETPNLDRLAANGFIFDAAYTTSPLCVPARLSFTAGKYISRCSAWSNSQRLASDDYPSLPHILNKAGYESVLSGKMHYDKDYRYGFTDLYPSRHNSFTKSGLGMRRKADDTGSNIETWISRSSRFEIKESHEHMDRDIEVTEKTQQFLKDRNPDDKPFFILAGYIGPHFPFYIPEKFYNKYKDRIPMPNIPEGFLETLPTNYKQLRIN